MSLKNLSSCGIDCGECEFSSNKEGKCPGCYKVQGKPFWSEKDGNTCDLYECAQNKKCVKHCGKCGEFACKMLTEWAFSEEGENGKRIENLKILIKSEA